MIPKTIHYCWFGHNEKSELIQKCITSWQLHCPEYEIIEWNESNFDISTSPYIYEAYQSKKWAFVSDVARLSIIFNNGGIYLDTDVELLCSLDCLIENDAFFAFESNRNIATGLGFGAVKNHIAINQMLKSYEGRHFIRNGKLDLTPCPDANTEALTQNCVLFKRNGQTQSFNNILVLSEHDYSNIAVHYGTATWVDGNIHSNKKRSDNAFKRFLRSPKRFDFLEKYTCKKVIKTYTFIVYDLLEMGPLYFIKRKFKKSNHENH